MGMMCNVVKKREREREREREEWVIYAFQFLCCEKE